MMAGWDRTNMEEALEHKFEKLYQENLDRVYRYIVSIVHHETVAEDLTAEVFITIWKKRSSLLDYENIVGLLYKISRDLSFNYLKSLVKNRKKKEEFFRHYFGLYSANDEYILREIQLSALEQAIDQLPEKCREVVKMKFLLGKSLKEIASELHISVNTVQNHLTKGKFLIKELIKSDEAFLILVLTITGFV